MSAETNGSRPRGRGILRHQYSDDQQRNGPTVCDPFDIDSADFNCDLYLNKVYFNQMNTKYESFF